MRLAGLGGQPERLAAAGRHQAQAGVAGALAALAPRAAYTRDPHLFVWDLVCSAVALASSEVCFFCYCSL